MNSSLLFFRKPKKLPFFNSTPCFPSSCLMFPYVCRVEASTCEYPVDDPPALTAKVAGFATVFVEDGLLACGGRVSDKEGEGGLINLCKCMLRKLCSRKRL